MNNNIIKLEREETFMEGYVKWMDGLSKTLKIVFSILVLDLTWSVYKLFRSIVAKNWTHMVFAILWIVVAPWFGWILDLVWLLWKGHVFWFEKD